MQQAWLQALGPATCIIQNVQDLPSALAAADGLVDFWMNKVSENGPSEGKKPKSKDKNYKRKGKKRDTDGKKDNDYTGKGKKKSGESSKAQGGFKFNSGCFICDGPHRAKYCPKREKLNAMVTEEKNEDFELHNDECYARSARLYTQC